MTILSHVRGAMPHFSFQLGWHALRYSEGRAEAAVSLRCGPDPRKGQPCEPLISPMTSVLSSWQGTRMRGVARNASNADDCRIGTTNCWINGYVAALLEESERVEASELLPRGLGLESVI